MRTADLAGRIDSVEHRMDSIEQRLDASYASLGAQILQSRRETNDAILATRTDLSRDISVLRSDSSVLRTEFAVLRSDFSEMRSEFAVLRSDFSEMRSEFAVLRIEFSEMRSVMLDRFEKADKALVDGLAETRGFMKILYENILSRIALLGEGRPSS